MTMYTVALVTMGAAAVVCILMAIWVCVAEKWQKKLDQRSVKSIIDRPRNIIK